MWSILQFADIVVIRWYLSCEGLIRDKWDAVVLLVGATIPHGLEGTQGAPS